MGDAVSQIVHNILNVLSPILSPDWGALVALIPVFLVIGVVGPIVSLLVLAWFVYVVRAPRARLPYIEPVPAPAQFVDGVPVYPAGEPYCPFDQLVTPPGQTSCPECGRELVVRCPKCGVGRAAYLDTCANCGLVLHIEPRALALRPADPPPGGAAAA